VIVYDSTVSERYAQALFNVAQRQGSQHALLDEVLELLKLFTAKSRLRSFLEGPQVTTEAKTNLLRNAFEGKVSPLMFQLFNLLLLKGRIEYVEPILQRFRILVERSQGIYEANVWTARALGDDQRTLLQSTLEKYTSNRLRIQFYQDPSLIGGVRFMYGDTLIDDSVKGKLERLRHQLESAASA
jgi:F-type H+-transporting ATPase subunit delta